jgi:DNA-binding PadR family transcriptional regulator
MPKRNKTMVQQLILLGILQKEKMHGYQLNEVVMHAMGSYTDLKKATVYYTLEKLEKGGYVQHKVEREGKRPERYVYQITKRGRSYFLDLLRKHLKSFTRAYYADDVAISFMDQLSTDEVRHLLAEKREKIQTKLQQFREHPEYGKNWRYVFSHNIAHLEVDLSWISEILKDIDRRNDNNVE